MGLLDGFSDFAKTPEGQGLLAATFGGLASAQRGAPINSLGRAGLAGLAGYGNAQDRDSQAARAEQQRKYQEQVMAHTQMQMDAAKRDADRKANIGAGMGKFFTPAQEARPALPSMDGMLPPEFRTGAAPMVAQPAKPAGFDAAGAAQFLAQNGEYGQALPLLNSLAPKQPKFSTAPQYDQQGRAFLVAEDGTMRYLDGVKARDKLQEVRLGDKVGFRTDYSPEIQGSLPMGQSPDSKASNALGWANNSLTRRGQDMTDARARDLNAIKLGEKKRVEDLTKGGQIASFDTMLGTLNRLSEHPGLARSVGVVGAFPTMPGSESANFKAELDTFQSQAFIPMVSQLKGMGALSDAEGKKLTAAVGALNPNMGEKAFRESIDRITSEMESARARVSGQPTPQQSQSKTPMRGQVVQGYKFKGGNPADKSNWEKQ